MKTNLLLSLFISCLLMSCNPEEVIPLPEFSLVDDYYLVGEPLQFSHVSQETNYQWDFGNGETSNLREPFPISYAQPGIYTITLTIGPSAQARVVQQEVRVGHRRIYEVQLLSFIENHWLHGGSALDPFQGNADIYWEALQYNAEINDYDLLYRSEVTADVGQGNLPLTWETESFPFSAIIRFYDQKDGRIIATTNFASIVGRDFSKEEEEGFRLFQRGATVHSEPGQPVPMFSRVLVNDRVEFPF